MFKPKLSLVYTRAAIGIQAPLVTVETHISRGLPRLSIVGLPEAAVKESKDRVRSAILNSNLEFPRHRIVINLAPADLPKEGGRYDLPIALGILAASKQIPQKRLVEYEFAGELALSGKLRPIVGALPLALGTMRVKRALIIPIENAFEATLPKDNLVYCAENLIAVCKHITQEKKLPVYKFTAPDSCKQNTSVQPNMSDIFGQAHAKRALEIAAAGGHSMLMTGPPGTGKTMLASRLPSIMPPLPLNEFLEVAAIYSLINKKFLEPRDNQHNPHNQHNQRPFRSPHHTASAIAMVGGGSNPKPGEISLAHRGILFLDELPEFDRKVLEVLREPLEAGKIIISRAARQAEFPASFQLIGAMNPCPCGYAGHPNGKCQCTIEQIRRYQAKLSGPLIDRIDLHLDVPMLPPEFLTEISNTPRETSETICQRVITAQKIQYNRQKKLNSHLTNNEIKKYCPLSTDSQKILKKAIEKFSLSARSYYRILKISRSIAELANSENITSQHINEAISFRSVHAV